MNISTLTDNEESVMLDKVLELAIEAGLVEVENDY